MKFKYRNRYGQGLKRCTAICDLIANNKDQLMYWAAKVGLDGMKKKTSDACTLGTYVHSKLEEYITGNSLPQKVKDFETLDSIIVADKAIDAWKRWEDAVQPEYLANEITIITDRWGGMSDFVVRINRTIEWLGHTYYEGDHVGDFKTSKGLYRSHVVQACGYSKGINEMLQKYDQHDWTKIREQNPEAKIIKLDKEVSYTPLLVHIDKEITIDDINIVPKHIEEDVAMSACEEFDLALRLVEIFGNVDKFVKKCKKV